MSFIVITINTDNAAFDAEQGPFEVQLLLAKIGDKLRTGSLLSDNETEQASDWVIVDTNGNHVGHVECENDPIPSDEEVD